MVQNQFWLCCCVLVASWEPTFHLVSFERTSTHGTSVWLGHPLKCTCALNPHTHAIAVQSCFLGDTGRSSKWRNGSETPAEGSDRRTILPDVFRGPPCSQLCSHNGPQMEQAWRRVGWCTDVEEGSQAASLVGGAEAWLHRGTEIAANSLLISQIQDFCYEWTSPP